MEELGWLAAVRHGQSTGNVAAQRAEEQGLDVIDLAERDADVPLTDLGRRQAEALGSWLAELPPERRPQIAVVSPYLRTVQTARIALGSAVPQVFDERLRDRELGILDLLTRAGVERRYPDEAVRRRRLGKLYYRPPGGESWADVLLRLRSLMGDVRQAHPGGRVLLVGHEALVLLLRYLVEGLSEAELLTLAHGTSLGNCSVSSWAAAEGVLRPECFNLIDHLERHGAVATVQEDVSGQAH